MRVVGGGGDAGLAGVRTFPPQSVLQAAAGGMAAIRSGGAIRRRGSGGDLWPREWRQSTGGGIALRPGERRRHGPGSGGDSRPGPNRKERARPQRYGSQVVGGCVYAANASSLTNVPWSIISSSSRYRVGAKIMPSRWQSARVSPPKEALVPKAMCTVP